MAVSRWGQEEGWGTSPSKSWLGLPNLAVPLTHCGQLILGKISKFNTIRCQILRLKCKNIALRWGSALGPAGRVYTASANSLPVFKGLTSNGRETDEGRMGRGMGGEIRGKWNGEERGGGREGRGREGRGGAKPPLPHILA